MAAAEVSRMAPERGVRVGFERGASARRATTIKAARANGYARLRGDGGYGAATGQNVVADRRPA